MLPVLRENQPLFAVRLRDGTHGAAGIPEGQIPVGDVLGDYAPRADDHVVPDMDAPQHHGVAGDPDVVPDVDVMGILGHGGAAFRVQAHALLGDEGMVGGHQGDARAEADVVPDVNAGVVHHRQAEVGEEIFPDEGVAAVVELDRTLEIEGGSHAPQHIQNQIPAGGVKFIQLIVPPADLVGLVLDLSQLRASGIKHMPGKYFLFFRHFAPLFLIRRLP